MRSRVLVVSLVLLAGGAVARADGLDAWSVRPSGLELQLGIASPLGLGVAADLAPVRWLSLGGGLGHSATALQVAVCARARPWSNGRRALYLGLCGSAGGYSEPTPDDGTRREAARAYWASPELGVEWRSLDGLTARVFVGPTFLLNPDAVHCTGAAIASCEAGETWGTSMPFGGVALGWSL